LTTNHSKGISEDNSPGLKSGTNSPGSVRSIAKKPKTESLKNFIAMAKRNFSKTEGLLYALLFVFVLTFIVFPSVSFHTTMRSF
jgi:cell division protein FtsL